jgi:hypothetical protein
MHNHYDDRYGADGIDKHIPSRLSITTIFKHPGLILQTMNLAMTLGCAFDCGAI